MNRFSHIYFYRLSIVIRGSWSVKMAPYIKGAIFIFPIQKADYPIFG